MRKTSTSTIDGQKYEVGHWTVDKQIGIMTRLIKLLGEPLAMTFMGAMSGGKKDVKSILETDMTKGIGEAVRSLVLRLNEEEVKSLLREIATDSIICDNKPFDYNTHFMGRIGHLLKVVMFSVRHQYADFLDVLPGLGGVLGAQQVSTTPES